MDDNIVWKENEATQLFRERINGIFSMIGEKALTYYEAKGSRCSDLYAFIYKYAMEKQLPNTIVALPVVRAIISQAAKSECKNGLDETRYLKNFEHALFVSRMLIDLNVNFRDDEEDIAIAAALCHILPEHIKSRDLEDKLKGYFHLDPRVYKIVRLLYEDGNLPDSELREYYENIQKNKLALLVTLTDRANVVEELYDMSTWEVHRYIHETRNYYFPMCIYAKEHYYSLISPVSILKDKIRTLTEVSEILLNRFEAREAELLQDIIRLKEDNATIKGIIKELC
ncbi:MAG: hypothetical protein HUJ72_00015 [Blautia sp.]|nr:hypothetical protein [Blautia sp.]